MNEHSIPRPRLLVYMVVSIGASLLLDACKHEPMVVPEAPPGGGGGGDLPCDPNTVYFQQQVLPILLSSCTNPAQGLNCHHTANNENDWIQLTSHASLMASGVVQNGDLMEALVEDDPDKIMPRPPQPPLSPQQIALIGQWIQQGAQNNTCESSACDTLNVTYSGTIVPLVQQRCLGCHSGSNAAGGLNFGSWTTLNAVAGDGRLSASINHLPSGIAMPPTGPMLSDCRIRQFMLWTEAGAPNN